jgi:hypothetical protein
VHPGCINRLADIRVEMNGVKLRLCELERKSGDVI